MIPRSLSPSLFAVGVALATATARAGAQWQPLATGTTASLRGLSTAGDRVVWASGTKGTVIRSIDGGSTWAVDSIPGASRFDIRAIHTRSALVAHAAATAGRIWRTADGGKTWSLRYQASDTSVFLDAIVFLDDRRGLALGDPMAGRFVVLVTSDGGETWREAPMSSRPETVAGEAAFAASGTSLVALGPHTILIGSGGTAAHVFRSDDDGRNWSAVAPPIISGASSQGIFSLAFAGPQRGVAVGGDYQRADSIRGNAAFTADGGRHWEPATQPPKGYRSGAALYARGGSVMAVAVGPTGSDISYDGGRTWTALDSTGFNAVQFTTRGVAIAVGAGGHAARYDRTAPSRSPTHREHLTIKDR